MTELGKKAYPYCADSRRMEVADPLSNPRRLTMFVHHCTSCEKSQLIFPSQMKGVADDSSGLVFTCWCGAEQIWKVGTKQAA